MFVCFLNSYWQIKPFSLSPECCILRCWHIHWQNICCRIISCIINSAVIAGTRKSDGKLVTALRSGCVQSRSVWTWMNYLHWEAVSIFNAILRDPSFTSSSVWHLLLGIVSTDVPARLPKRTSAPAHITHINYPKETMWCSFTLHHELE